MKEKDLEEILGVSHFLGKQYPGKVSDIYVKFSRVKADCEWIPFEAKFLNEFEHYYKTYIGGRNGI